MDRSMARSPLFETTFKSRPLAVALLALFVFSTTSPVLADEPNQQPSLTDAAGLPQQLPTPSLASVAVTPLPDSSAQPSAPSVIIAPNSFITSYVGNAPSSILIGGLKAGVPLPPPLPPPPGSFQGLPNAEIPDQGLGPNAVAHHQKQNIPNNQAPAPPQEPNQAIPQAQVAPQPFNNRPGNEFQNGPFNGPPPPFDNQEPKGFPPVVPANMGFVLPFQLAALVLVAVPLLFIRRFESSRRRLSVWFFDLGRIIIGYAVAEILLTIFLIPYMAIVNSFRGPPPPWHGPGGWNRNISSAGQASLQQPNSNMQSERWIPPDARVSTGGSGVPDMHLGPIHALLRRAVDQLSGGVGGGDASAASLNNNDDHSLDKKPNNFRGNQNFGMRIETTSLVISLIELFPGLFCIYSLYMGVLYLTYRVKIILLTRSQRIRFVRSSLYDNSSDSDGFSENDSDSRNSRRGMRRAQRTGSMESFLALRDGGSLLAAKDTTAADLGLASGNYGYPVRVGWFLQQTGLFVLAVFIVRLAVFFICIHYSDATEALRQGLFGWTYRIESVAGRRFVVMILLPAIIYTVQFCVTDYLLKYRSSVAKRNLFFDVPTYLYGDESNSANMYPDSYELQEILIPRPDEHGSEVVVQAARRSLNPSSERASGGPGDRSPAVQSSPGRGREGDAEEPVNEEEEDDGMWDVSSGTSTVVGSNDHQRPDLLARSGSNAHRSASPKLRIHHDAVVPAAVLSRGNRDCLVRDSPLDLDGFVGSEPESMPRLGLVTATLLNTVAANATITARRYIYSGPNTSLDQPQATMFASPSLSSSSSPSPSSSESYVGFSGPQLHSDDDDDVFGDRHAYSCNENQAREVGSGVGGRAGIPAVSGILPGDLEGGRESDGVLRGDLMEEASPDGLPSYDDSQRQHRELLRDRAASERRARQIEDLKRRGVGSSSDGGYDPVADSGPNEGEARSEEDDSTGNEEEDRGGEESREEDRSTG